MSEKFTDADLTHPWVAKYRIPLIKSHCPHWRYEVALVAPGAFWTDSPMAPTWPTEDEAQVIGAFIEYRMEYYNAGWAAKMRQLPLDADSTTNTVVLLRTENSWQYRRDSWVYGPLFAPGVDEYPATVAGLIDLIGTAASWASGWADFQARRPELFPARVSL